MASVKPPLDKHSQNLTLHCIELQHHKRRMRLMLMAAQHQHGEGGVSLQDQSFRKKKEKTCTLLFCFMGWLVISLFNNKRPVLKSMDTTK